MRDPEKRAARAKVYNSRAWRAIRLQTLRDANYLCQIQLPGCTSTATQADHVIALEDGGPPFPGPDGRRASCAHCNVLAENRRRQGNPVPHRDFKPSRPW